MGSHRDPITSEKCWLDFAVRELSRVAAGKARGQEAVWKHRPPWWEYTGLTWKNPTANPKDSKDTLKTKFECLVKHLRKENQVPGNLEEEIQLWEAGRISEVFLMTTFSCMLGQTSTLHRLLDESHHKMAETEIGINPCILSDLENCLAACQKMIDFITNLSAQKSRTGEETQVSMHAPGPSSKRAHENIDEAENTAPTKRARVSSPTITSSSSSAPSQTSSSVPEKDSKFDPQQQKCFMALLQQKILLNKAGVAATQQRPVCVQAKPTKRGTTVKHSRPVATVVNAAPSISVGGPVVASMSYPATVTHPTFIPGNYLGIDFLEETTIEDLQFLDELLAENSTLAEAQTRLTTPHFPLNADTEITKAEIRVANETNSDVSDLFTLSSTSAQSVATEIGTDIVPQPLTAVAGRSWSLEDEVVSFEEAGSDACVNIRGTTPELGDAGYSSESSPMHRSSVDSVSDILELNSDFEDLLDFEF